jgi:3-isopropylmalate/(R)-2-methylmalate dehydratase large subunit
LLTGKQGLCNLVQDVNSRERWRLRSSLMVAPKTLLDKIWDRHVVRELSDGRTLVHIDRHILHDGTSRQAFDGMRKLKRRFHNLDLNLAVVDHIVATLPGRTAETNVSGRERIHALQANCREFDVELYDVDNPRQGIVHVIAPELGFVLPGCTVVCGDSHTATNGALGALAWGIGTTEVMHVMAAQALLVRRPKTMRVTFSGPLPYGIYAKDLVLHLIGKHGVSAGAGFAVEYAGSTINALPIEGRMTICNMSVEFGARMGLIAVDDETLQYVAERPFAPKGALWDQALPEWRGLVSDHAASFDCEIAIDCREIEPQVSWGTTPQDIIPVGGRIPDPAQVGDAERRRAIQNALAYMDLAPGQALEGVPIDYAFIGSCTNSRLSDLEAAASILKGRKIHDGVTALVVPGSMTVKAAAEAIGLDKIFRAAGFEWRNAGCSMCVTSNGDIVAPGKRCISTTNRNFEHRQGSRSRTHLASPAMVAAAAVKGCITDVRKLLN